MSLGTGALNVGIKTPENRGTPIHVKLILLPCLWFVVTENLVGFDQIKLSMTFKKIKVHCYELYCWKTCIVISTANLTMLCRNLSSIRGQMQKKLTSIC